MISSPSCDMFMSVVESSLYQQYGGWSGTGRSWRLKHSSARGRELWERQEWTKAEALAFVKHLARYAEWCAHKRQEKYRKDSVLETESICGPHAGMARGDHLKFKESQWSPRDMFHGQERYPTVGVLHPMTRLHHRVFWIYLLKNVSYLMDSIIILYYTLCCIKKFIVII